MLASLSQDDAPAQIAPQAILPARRFMSRARQLALQRRPDSAIVCDGGAAGGASVDMFAQLRRLHGTEIAVAPRRELERRNVLWAGCRLSVSHGCPSFR
ncbi:MAG TPA: hypothetical protein VKB76_04250, partial [Ktedonobacterales bacterium]|nr:hypothetical protein [Ktedonobacterales bacterium]